MSRTASRDAAGNNKAAALYPPPFGTRRHREDDCDPDDFGGDLAILAWPWQEGGFWMHRGGNNLLFDDGHVALFGKYDSTRMTFHPTQMQDWAEVTPGY
jgi:prepilin-type processing-associated H-X9-DG protein